MQAIMAIDFDGTIADHRYPDIGEEVPGAFEWMRKWKDAGAILTLLTMRKDCDEYGPMLQQAIDFCESHGIVFDSVNESYMVEPWMSAKVYANAYVDDAAIGCPLIANKRMGGRPMVDWSAIGPAGLTIIDSLRQLH